jgi:hypothetical protein
MSNLGVIDGEAMLQADKATYEAAEAPAREPESAPSATRPPALTTVPTVTPAPTQPPAEEPAPGTDTPVMLAPSDLPAPEIATMNGIDDAGAGINVWEDGLRVKVANSAVENSVALRALLEDEDLDDDVREALLQVLDLLAEGYYNVLNR